MRRTGNRWIGVVLVLAAAAMPGAYPALAADDAALLDVQARLERLERRVADLERAAAPAVEKAQAEQRVEQQRANARERMRQDLSVYTREQLQAIETLYQVANQKWQSDEARASLRELLEKYDHANRTGCAVLYLGQMTEGPEKEAHLRRAIKDFGDCRYGDGVQVGAYARFLLAGYLRATGDEQGARVLIDELRQDYEDAIDHRGRSLTAQLP